MNRNIVLTLIALLCITTTTFSVMQQSTDDVRFDQPLNLLEIAGGRNFVPVTWQPQFDGQKWQSFRYIGSKSIALASGSPIPLIEKGITPLELSEEAKRFVSDHSKEFGVDGCDLFVESVRTVRHQTIILVRPQIDDIPVYGGYVTLTLNQDLELMVVKALGFGSRSVGSFSIGEFDATDKARNWLGDPNGGSEVESVWIPQLSSDSRIELRAGYVVSLTPDNPALRPLIFIDAESGEIVAAENRVYMEIEGTITGMVHPEYPQDDFEEYPFSDEYVRLNNGGGHTYTDDNGNFGFGSDRDHVLTSELSGRWVQVMYEDGDDAEVRMNVNRDNHVEINWDDDNSRDDERMLFHHTNFIHSFWKGLDPDFDGMDYQVPATCQVGNNYNNAYWNGHGMYFGGGGGIQGRNFALYPDIIYHEYGHGITSNIYPRDLMPYILEPGSLNEAWSDYYPSSIFDGPLVSEDANGGNYMRDLDNELRYDGNVNPEVHSFGRIASGAMWHTREVIGQELADDMFHFARYALGNQFLDYFVDVLAYDDDNGDLTDGTPHYQALYEQFGRHAIGPGVAPRLTITELTIKDDQEQGADGNDDGLLEAGERVRINVSLRRGGFLYPPPVENVRFMISCESEHVTIIQDEAEVGDMYVDDHREDIQPLLFEINEAAGIGFADIILNVIGGEDQYIIKDTIRITVGVPELLIVRDGDDDMVSGWYESALDELDLPYARFATAMPAGELEDWLDRFEVVIWFSGVARDIMDEESRALLTNFIQGGGDVLLTSQDVGSVPGIESFLRDNFGAVVENDSVRGMRAFGVEGDPVTDGVDLLIIGDHGARNQVSPDLISAIEPAVGIFRWDRLDGYPTAGVRLEHDNGARTIYLPFGLEAVSGLGRTATRSEAIAAMLRWFGSLSAVSEDVISPDRFTLEGVYPNPFNDRSVVRFTVATAGDVNLSVYDLSGRLVSVLQSGQMDGGDHAVDFDAQGLASGTYLFSLTSKSGRKISKAVLLR